MRIIYIIDESLPATTFSGNEFQLVQSSELSIIDEDKEVHLILFHYGGFDSSYITSFLLQEALEDEGLGTALVQKILCFSRVPNEPASWDHAVLSFLDQLSNGESFIDAGVSLLEEEHDTFQENIQQNDGKGVFRSLIGSFLLNELNGEQTSDESIKELLEEFEGDWENFRSHFSGHCEAKMNTGYIDLGHPIYFENLELAKRQIVEQLKLTNVEFLVETLFFRPSPRLWKLLGILKEKVYVILHCPWRSVEGFSNQGFDPDVHKNIVFWNPLDGIEELRTKLPGAQEETNNDQTALLNLEEIKGLVFRGANELIAPLQMGAPNRLSKLIHPIKCFRYPFANFFSDSPSDIGILQLFDALGNNFDQHTHSINATNDPISDDFNLDSLKVFKLRERCADALDSVYYKYLSPEPLTLGIIDDRSVEDIDTGMIELLEILSAFRLTTDEEVLGFNPVEKEIGNGRKALDLIKEYASVAHHDSSHGLHDLDKILDESDVVLLDLLFKDDGNKQSDGLKYKIEDGVRFISGLNRYMRDRSSVAKLPSLVTFSQDTNPKSITSALKAGAKDYIFKTRPFFIPATLLKARTTVGDTTTTFHKNFRAVYNLDNEVIGLLQSHTITDNSDEEIQKRRQTVVKEILSAIPKTDLHVHVGSCMSREFIALASFVSLMRLKYQEVQKVRTVISLFQDLLSGKPVALTIPFIGRIEISASGAKWVDMVAKDLRKALKAYLVSTIEKMEINGEEDATREELSRFRSFLHERFRIRDYLDDRRLTSAIDKVSSFELSFFAISRQVESLGLDDFDFVRIYLLYLLKKYKTGDIQFDGRSILDSMVSKDIEAFSQEDHDKLHQEFYGPDGSFSIDAFRKSGWTIGNKVNRIEVSIEMDVEPTSPDKRPDFDNDPIGHILATGPESGNLLEYLEGCEYSGAEHLQHPFLIHMYARQSLFEFIKHGTCYTELRSSPSGYVNSKWNFLFTDVMNCLINAFNEAQTEVYNHLVNREDLTASWETLSEINQIQGYNSGNDPLKRRLPCKVNLIITGKRHKPLRAMILEAAAAASLRRDNISFSKNSSEFTKHSLTKTEVVGFDLAGKEEGNPPEKFVEEFSRLSKLHIPLTIHAGENASSEFIESAVIKVGARRIGHGLSLAEDKDLMHRLREQRVSIELCPVCNHQTSHFFQDSGRSYPLKKYLDAGLLVSINTDNPIISNTNIVEEYFKASKTVEKGLSLWEALRITRMGFTTSFMSLPERKHFLQIIDQYLFDLFSTNEVIELLLNLGNEKR